ncbi:MAG: bifunctional precorrin-2 dehydrogenase/sirohydrochlorin ferrochelatase [Spirochaetaceae bacterium]|nr:bifunctional precorrin-2 dehydrogenase/sirohydrochlorin ferrochelatase [Spirochaetaceae bacterium]
MASIGTPEGAQFNPHFQVGLNVAGRRCLVIGGGAEALDKTLRLLDARARVLLVAPELCAGLADLQAAGRVDWRQRRYRSDDLRGACLIINTERSDPVLCERVFTAAQRSRIPINTYDLPQYSTLAMAALVTCGHLRISISTSNAAPAAAGRLRRDLADLLAGTPDLEEFMAVLGEIRGLAKQHVANPGERRALLRGLASGLRLHGTIELPRGWRNRLASVEAQLRQHPQPGGGDGIP